MNTNNFDLLRFLFASTVAFGHLLELTPDTTLDFLRPYIHLPYVIEGFYVISGFLITKSYYRSTSLRSYFIKRVKRIFPAYYFNIIFFSLILSLVSIYSFSEYFSDIEFYRYLFFNLLFQNYLQPTLPGVFENNLTATVNGALWTIKIEETFYLFVPLILLIFKKLHQNLSWFLVIYLCSTLFYNYFCGIDEYRIAKQLPGVMTYFVSGMFLYHQFEWMMKYRFQLLILAIAAIYVELTYSPYVIFFPFAYALLILLFAYIYPFAKNFGKYGDFTYGIYIFHYPIIQLTVTLGLYLIYPPYWVFACTLLVILLCGVLSWYGIERHFVNRSYLKTS